ncbi:MAG TPA: MG2 domain-containing protein, partial [Pyrinomonadaceae bacterium]|nr:MG2 domain-containing protein [Pyrinomonadaceae bacterium]
RVLPEAGADERQALPPDAAVSVSVGAGTPSAEGPLKTMRPQEFRFNTFGAFRVAAHVCGEPRCSPYDTWQVVFSNPLDTDSFKPSLVRVEPPLEGFQARAWNEALSLDGWKQGRRTYRVTLDRSLRDSFGQTLGRDVTLTFNVGSDIPSIEAGRMLVVHDPAAPPSYSVFTVNVPALKVSLYRTTPADWPAYVEYFRSVVRNERVTPPPPGSLVVSRTVKVRPAPDETVETVIDLRPALNAEGLGHVYVVVEPSGYVRSPEQQLPSMGAWVQVTNIGLDAFVDREELLGWATSLKSGEPLGGVELSIEPTQARAASGPDGLARIPLPKAKQEARLLVARRGSDTAFLPESAGLWSNQTNWHWRPSGESFRWYVFDDRKTYRPGEQVRVKGWLRRFGGDKPADLVPLGNAATSVAYTLKDARGNKVGEGALRLNPLGGFDLALKLPDAMNLGPASLELNAQTGTAEPQRLGTQTHRHVFQVQEFRRPEYQVSVEADPGPHFVGGHTSAAVTANYYAGGGLPDTGVSWQVSASEAHFTPPNRDAFTFGGWTPWWRINPRARNASTKSLQGRTDASGKHRLRVDFDAVEPARASTLTVQATVEDVNRQAWADTKTLLVHPSELYVGLRAERTFVQRGEPLEVDAIVTDIEGRAAAGREVRVRASLLEWVREGKQWVERETKTKECAVKSTGEAVR